MFRIDGFDGWQFLARPRSNVSSRDSGFDFLGRHRRVAVGGSTWRNKSADVLSRRGSRSIHQQRMIDGGVASIDQAVRRAVKPPFSKLPKFDKTPKWVRVFGVGTKYTPLDDHGTCSLNAAFPLLPRGFLFSSFLRKKRGKIDPPRRTTTITSRLVCRSFSSFLFSMSALLPFQLFSRIIGRNNRESRRGKS